MEQSLRYTTVVTRIYIDTRKLFASRELLLYICASVKQTDYHSATGLNYIATYAGVEQEAWVWEQSWEQAKVPFVAGLEYTEMPFRASLERSERMFRADVDPFHSTCEATFVQCCIWQALR